MKKSLLSLSSVFFFFTISSAQSVKIGIQAGSVVSQAVEKDNLGNKTRYDLSVGGTAGIIFDIPVGQTLSIQPAVNYLQKGVKFIEYWENYPTNEKKKLEVGARPQYIEVPINFIYNSRTNKGNFFYGLGPTFAFAIGGKMDTLDAYSYPDLTTSSTKMKFGNTMEDDMRTFDFGGNVLTGYESKSGFYVSATYNIGLSNLLPKFDGNNEKEERYAHFHYIGFKVGWILKGKTK